jgi:hypothetical protein
MRRALLTAVLAALCSGCSIWDEIGGPSAPEPKKAAGGSEAATGTPQARLQQLRDQYQRDAKPAEVDADNVIVRCSTNGATQFMRKYDCQLRGGRISS